MRLVPVFRSWIACALFLAGPLTFAAFPISSRAGEPDPSSYWDVKDIQPGMKGVGRTVMVGTKMEEFQAEVLGVMRDVSPGRDMILCRLSGCNLEHAGIIQGMSGSPIYIDGKLVGAVAYAWEFAKDPIAGVTPFSQMVQYVRSNDRRIAAEAKDQQKAIARRTAALDLPLIREDDPTTLLDSSAMLPTPVAGGGMAGMKPIAMPLAASGFSPRALEVLSKAFAPLGMAPMAGGAAQEEIIAKEGDKPLEPGSPLSIAMVTGDFDLSGIGTVTHVEGDRVYGFGHPMLGLGACELPLMTGYIHTVYPRASVSMKMGSPLKVVGVLDTDVSTCVAGRIGPKPDMLPMTVRVKSGRYADSHTYKVQLVREPNLLPGLVMSVLTNAIDTEGNLPEELTAQIDATIALQGHEPIHLRDTLSGPRYSGPLGPSALFGPISGIVNVLARNPMEPVRITSIDCSLDITAGRSTADLESVRLVSNRVAPGGTVEAVATLKPFHGERKTIRLEMTLPDDLPEGNYEADICDVGHSMRRRIASQSYLTHPQDVKAILDFVRLQIEPQRTTLFLHVALPDRGLAVQGQPLPNLPGSVRAVLADDRGTTPPAIRDELIETVDVPWVVDGSESLKFEVAKDTGIAYKE